LQQYHVIRCRIERAKQLMVIGDWLIATIAQMVGFASQGHFTYHFKRLTARTLKMITRTLKRSTPNFLQTE
jgi:AraC family transcriptional regulator